MEGFSDSLNEQGLRHHFPFHNWHIRRKRQSFFATIDLNGLTFVELAGQDLERQRVLQLALDGPFERTGAEAWTVAYIRQVLAGGLDDFEMNFRQTTR